MNESIIKTIAQELNVTEKHVQAVLDMLNDGSTVAFIARYRKDATGAMDEEQILYIEKQYKYQINLAERKESVIALIEQQGKLTDEIKDAIMACDKLSQVEDLYKPYKQKKKTRAAEAIKNGLQPLADFILLPTNNNLEEEANKYLNENIDSIDKAIQGAKDIIAEMVSDNAKLRWDLKDYINDVAIINTKIKKDAQDEKKVYEMYYDYEEKANSMADHRIMAIDRAEKEKIIIVKFEYDLNHIQEKTYKVYINDDNRVLENVLKEAIDDGLSRLLLPSIENEIRNDLSKRAQDASIEVFSLNLENLLSQAPLKGRVVLGFDPGFFNGCKLAVVDATGKLLEVKKIYPFRKEGDDGASKPVILDLIKRHNIKIIAIGNGTASRESEALVAQLIKENDLDVEYAIVSEAGASVWSAQEDARIEFPDLQVEERSAVSIGRRLLDPLSELIKIDPKSIGVGQYQHDLPPKELSQRLNEATDKVVNRVGADLNTSSVELLTHISGLNKAIANEIVNYRNKNGRFNNRQELLNVKKLGEKAFEQCAGFLRIIDGDEVLDSTSIHPESYEIARKIMKVSNIDKLGSDDIIFDDKAINELNIDEYTLNDIKDAIKTPLRDYRDQFDAPVLKSNILELKDLKVGDELSGTIRNVVDFGAFCDIGLHEDGLIHISRMSNHRINHPSEVVGVNDIVKVYVYEIDEVKQRVSLSLLSLEELARRDSDKKQWKSRKKAYNKLERKEVNEDEAMQRLLERFGSKH